MHHVAPVLKTTVPGMRDAQSWLRLHGTSTMSLTTRAPCGLNSSGRSSSFVSWSAGWMERGDSRAEETVESVESAHSKQRLIKALCYTEC